MPVIPVDPGWRPTPRGSGSPLMDIGGAGQVGAQLQQVAQEGLRLAEQWQDDNDIIAARAAQGRAVEWLAREQVARRAAAPAGGGNYTNEIVTAFREYREEVGSGLTPGAMRRLDEWWGLADANLVGDSVRWQRATNSAFRADQLNGTVENYARALASTPPADLGRAYAQARLALVAMEEEGRRTGAIPPDDGGAWLRGALETLAKSASDASLLGGDAIAPPPAGGGGGNYFANVRASESGGQANAQNPNSTASGLYQFTRATWEGLGFRWADRFDPATQERAMVALTRRNGEHLNRELGHTPADWEMYGAHFFGPAGYVQVSRLPDSANLSDELSAQVLAANPMLRDMTAGDLRAMLQRKMGLGTTWQQDAGATQVAEVGGDLPLPDMAVPAVPEGAPAWMADMSASDLIRYRDQARINAAAAERDAAAAQAEQQTFAYNVMDVGVSEGTVSRSDIDAAYRGGLITIEKWNDLTNRAIERDRDASDALARMTTVQAALSGSIVLDPGDSETRKGVDELYRVMAGQWSAAQVPPEQQVARTVAYIGQTGIVPDSVQGQIRGSLAAGTTDQKVFAADLLDQIGTTNRAALESIPEGDREVGMLIAEYRRLGVADADAVRMAEAEVYEIDQGVRDRRRQQLNAYSGAMLTTFENGHLSYDYPVAEGPAGDAFRVAGRQLYQRFYEDVGDPVVAQRLTDDALRAGGWAESSINGDSVMMLYPPEVTHPTTGHAAETASTWMREQLADDLIRTGLIQAPSAIAAPGLIIATPGQEAALPEGPQVDAALADIRVESDPQTRRDGTYAVVQRDENGVPMPLTNPDGTQFRWAPSWPDSREFQRYGDMIREQQAAAERARQDAARITDPANLFLGGDIPGLSNPSGNPPALN